MKELLEKTKELHMMAYEIHRIANYETNDKVLHNLAMTLTDIAYTIRMYVLDKN